MAAAAKSIHATHMYFGRMMAELGHAIKEFRVTCFLSPGFRRLLSAKAFAVFLVDNQQNLDALAHFLNASNGFTCGDPDFCLKVMPQQDNTCDCHNWIGQMGVLELLYGCTPEGYIYQNT